MKQFTPNGGAALTTSRLLQRKVMFSDVIPITSNRQVDSEAA